MARKNLVLTQLESGCIIPVSHKLNHDGYFRKIINGKHQMYHRIVYEYVYGSIPEGYEINHKCHNRACCNLSHLECIDGTDHAVLTNEERYKERSVAMKDYWIKTKCTGTFLGERFGVSFSTACKHIREWR